MPLALSSSSSSSTLIRPSLLWSRFAAVMARGVNVNVVCPLRTVRGVAKNVAASLTAWTNIVYWQSIPHVSAAWGLLRVVPFWCNFIIWHSQSFHDPCHGRWSAFVRFKDISSLFLRPLDINCITLSILPADDVSLAIAYGLVKGALDSVGVFLRYKMRHRMILPNPLLPSLCILEMNFQWQKWAQVDGCKQTVGLSAFTRGKSRGE